MNLNGKNVLVMGLGISGVSTIRALEKLGAKIAINDIKTEEELKDVLYLIRDISLEKFLGKKDIDLSPIDLIVKSPGIPPSNDLISKAIGRDKDYK